MKLHPAYIAGIVDSDSSLSISATRLKNHKNLFYKGVFSLTWSANEKTEAIMKIFVEMYGGTYHYCPSKGRTAYNNSKAFFKYSLVNLKTIPFILDILPYLCLKRRQARNILRLCKILNKVGTNRQTEQQLRIKQTLYRINKKLNSKNKPVRIVYGNN